MLEFEKFLQYLNVDVAPAIGLFLLVSSVRTLVTIFVVIRPGFLYDAIDAHSFAVLLLLVQWLAISAAPLVSVRTHLSYSDVRITRTVIFVSLKFLVYFEGLSSLSSVRLSTHENDSESFSWTF